jgi:glycerol-1-phosphate dehydrogenase [NAD(P)+]
MTWGSQIAVPTLVRIKPGALSRVGLYLSRSQHDRVSLLTSHALPDEIGTQFRQGLDEMGIALAEVVEIADASFEESARAFSRLAPKVRAVVGLGGGKALDVAKYVAFLARLPYYAVPTSLSNDGFCSPQSSLTIEGRRRSLPARLPFGVVIDTDVCLAAPPSLWASGVGDLVAKLTAVHDWKLAFHAVGEPVNDFAALLSDATVMQFLARPEHDREGMTLLGTALMLSGIAMEVCGSSRPASGSEHLLSHALDQISKRPRLHGLQVGVATYIVSILQNNQTERIAGVLDRTGFWDVIAADPFSRREWIAAAGLAPNVKADFYTILSTLDPAAAVERMLHEDQRLARCFVD